MYVPLTQHILSARHKERIRANPFNRDILLIQHKYSLTRLLQPKDRDTQFSNLIVIDEDP